MGTGVVSVDGQEVEKSLPEIFQLYASISDPEERRRVLAPPDEHSTGDCEVREVIVSDISTVRFPV